jgi:sec-independent protein translocase protein TatA
MFNVGPTELMVILVLALIVFGPKKLPEMGKSIGKGLREFQKAKSDIRREISQGLNESPSQETAPEQPSAAGTGTAVSDGQGASEQPTP